MPDDQQNRPFIRLPREDSALLAECVLETYRSSGPGGQHVNTTDSAVRLKHLPSGITVSCQESRSQRVNKDRCVEKLREEVARLNYRPRKRVPTQISRGVQQRRLNKKSINSDKKQQRRPPRRDD